MVNDIILERPFGSQVMTSNAAVDTFIKIIKQNIYISAKLNVLDYMLVNQNVKSASKYWSTERIYKNHLKKKYLGDFLNSNCIYLNTR